MKLTNLGFLAFAFIATATIGACSRAHLGSNYGQSYSAWFQAQHVTKKPANAEAARRIVESLDAGEAALVSKNYRKTVAKGEESSSRMLMIGPQRGDAYVPQSSVPGQ